MCANHKINYEEAIKPLSLKKDWKPSEELEEKNFETWLNQYDDNKEGK